MCRKFRKLWTSGFLRYASGQTDRQTYRYSDKHADHNHHRRHHHIYSSQQNSTSDTDTEAVKHKMPINAGCLYNLNHIIQLYKVENKVKYKQYNYKAPK